MCVSASDSALSLANEAPYLLLNETSITELYSHFRSRLGDVAPGGYVIDLKWCNERFLCICGYWLNDILAEIRYRWMDCIY